MIRAWLIVDRSFFPAPGDYVPVAEALTFSASETRICTNVMTNDDTIFENDEDFGLILTTTDGNVILNPDEATVTIDDDDCKPKRHISTTDWREND